MEQGETLRTKEIRSADIVIAETGSLTTAEAAQQLGVGSPRIIQLIDEGRLKGQKAGKTWLIDAKSFKAYSDAVGPKKKSKPARKMGESDAMMAAAAARRIVQSVLVTGVQMADKVTVIRYEEFGKLRVDEGYQRMRIGTEVNQIIHALKAGGAVPDPVDIAERPDGSWWIVDGQQRFWAHDECRLPLRAMVHKVESREAEERLFIVLNSRRKVGAKVILKGWPGPAGQFIRRVNEDDRSPFFGMVDFSTSSHLPLDAMALLRGVLVVMTGLENAGGDAATVLLPRTDAALRIPGRQHWAEEFVRLIAAVFNVEKGAGRIRVLPIIALARVAFKKYEEAGRPVFPRTCAGLRRVNWDTIVPTHSNQYLPVLVEVIERRWK